MGDKTSENSTSLATAASDTAKALATDIYKDTVKPSSVTSFQSHRPVTRLHQRRPWKRGRESELYYHYDSPFRFEDILKIHQETAH